MKRFFLSLLFAFTVGIISFFISYFIAITVSPPYFYDAQSGEKYGLMPIGQVMIASLAGIFLGVITLIIAYRKYPLVAKRRGF